MVRLLLLVLALAVTSTAAEAQVFRPKSGAKKATPAAKTAPATAKKQPRAAPTKKRPTNPPKKKNAAADRGAPDDLTPEPEAKGAAKDYVKIWDDEEIE